MEITRSNLTQIEVIPTGARLRASGFFARAAYRMKVLWRSSLWRTVRKRKGLSIQETAALGDRRFVSVVQFEHQRFLIGSSAASVTLLALLPDQPSSGEKRGKECGEGTEHKRQEIMYESEEKN